MSFIPFVSRMPHRHTIGVDLIGPLPKRSRGNKYIMTVSCLFSRWPEATALPDESSVGVAEFLFRCFTRHGYLIKEENLSTRYIDLIKYSPEFITHTKKMS